MIKAVFLDRDGTLNRYKGFIHRKEDLILLPGIREALAILKARGYLLIVVTNQPIVARGILNEHELQQLHVEFNAALGNLLDDFYVCPHHPEMHEDVPEHARRYRIQCSCRKPLPGMLLQAAHTFSLDLKKSWMVGDTLGDIAAGKAAGCRTILVTSEQNTSIQESWPPVDIALRPDYYADGLLAATRFIQ